MSACDHIAPPRGAVPTPADPLATVGGRVTSARVSGENVARLQKAFDALVVVSCVAGALLAGTAPLDRYAILRIVVVAVFSMFAHLITVREADGYAPLCLIEPMRASLRLVTGLGVAAIAALVGIAVSNGWLQAWVPLPIGLGAAAAILVAERFAVARLLSRLDDAGRLTRRIAVVGGGEEARQVIARISEMGSGALDLCGFFDDRTDNRTPTSIGTCPNLGSVDDLVEFSRWFRIDMVVVALPFAADRRLYALLKQLWVIPAEIRISALGSPLRLSRTTYAYLGSLPLLAAFDRPLSSWGALVKAVFDRTVAALLLILLAPFLIAVAVAIRLDSPGPVLFRQPRYGFNNQLISIYKFRSMRSDAADRFASKLVTKDDPRVTRVGRFIRRTSIDELPQLINVVRGELSLVGPRPHAVKASAADRLYDEVVEGYFARHRVKPGITGWAQINGWRGETDTADKIERRVEHDLYYIDNWSLLFDLSILIRTPLALIHAGNAY